MAGHGTVPWPVPVPALLGSSVSPGLIGRWPPPHIGRTAGVGHHRPGGVSLVEKRCAYVYVPNTQFGGPCPAQNDRPALKV